MEWLALMRHFLSPVRLLDWTYSFYIAVFFAVASVEGPSAVWAVDTRWCNRMSHKRYPENSQCKSDQDPYIQKLESFRYFFARKAADSIPAVFRVNAFVLNERLAAQQGLFLCPTDVSKTFEDNLQELQNYSVSNGNSGDAIPKNHLHKICISGDPKVRRQVLEELAKMGITWAALTPGLDGLGRSMELRLARLIKLVPKWRTRRATSAFEDLSHRGL